MISYFKSYIFQSINNFYSQAVSECLFFCFFKPIGKCDKNYVYFKTKGLILSVLSTEKVLYLKIVCE